MAESHYTEEGTGFVDATQPDAVNEARKRHHLATADPDLEETMTGPAHERKYNLDREEGSAAALQAVGVHPYVNGALETADETAPVERSVPPKPAARK